MLRTYLRHVGDTARHGFVLAALVMAACSGKDEPKYPSITSYCAGRAQAECSQEVLKACAIANATSCTTKRRVACEAATPSGTVYNPNGAEACVNAVGSAFADAKLSSQENRTLVETCAALFDGPGAADSACKKDIDCKVSANLRCVLRGGSDSGTCQVPQRVTGGGVCSELSQLCVPGFHCGPTDHCDINGQIGEGCSALVPCVEAARCIASKCEKKLDDGSPCSNDQECANALCARGTGASSGLCVSQMTLAPNEPFCIDAR